MGQSNLPLAHGTAHVKAFERAGWTLARIRGSHHIMTKHGCEATLSVPCHAGRDLGRGMLSKFIAAAEMTEAEYLAHFSGKRPPAKAAAADSAEAD